jgi:FkbM family methyltransferase
MSIHSLFIEGARFSLVAGVKHCDIQAGPFLDNSAEDSKSPLTLMFLRALNEHWIWQRRLRVFGHLFRAPTLDRLATLWMHKLGISGRQEVHLLRQLLRPGMNVLDVGANQGIYTLLLAGIVRPGSVFAFEPHPFLYQQLVSNVEANNAANVVCHQAAVSRSSGSLTLHPGNLNRGDNRIVTGPSNTPGKITVDSVSLDAKFAGQKIDFLKIDVQGWEAEALFGARRVLEENMDLVVMFELWPYGLLNAGTPSEVLLAFLRNLGFQLWQIRQGRLAFFDQKDLPDPTNVFSYRNLVAARNPLTVKHLLSQDPPDAYKEDPPDAYKEHAP